MAGLLGYALAGGLTGYGNSLVEDAKAKREAAMEELRNSRLMVREDRQDHRQNTRDDKNWERQQQRDDRQHERGIDTSGKPVDVDGQTRLLRQDGSLGNITDAGEPFTGKISTGRDSSDPRYAIEAKRDMLIAAGWDEGRASEAAALGERPTGAVDRMKLVEDQLKTEYGKDLMSNDKTRAEIRERRSELMGSLDEMLGPVPSRAQTPESATQSTQQPDAPPTSTQGSGTQPSEDALRLPAGMTEEQVIEMARQAIPAKGKDAVRARLRQMGIDPAKAGL